jgi:hypothetical protein
MIKTHTKQQGKKFVFVQLYEGANRFKVFNDKEPYLSFFIGVDTYRKSLPKGKYKIIGLAKDFTDERCSDLGIDLLGLLLLALGFKETDNVLILELIK